MKNISPILLTSKIIGYFEYDCNNNEFSHEKITGVLSDTWQLQIKSVIQATILANGESDIPPITMNINQSTLKITFKVMSMSKVVIIVNDVTGIHDYHSKIETSLKEKDKLLDINHAILTINDLDQLYDYILAQVADIFSFSECGSILKIDEDGYLKIVASYGYSQSLVNSFKLKYTDTYQFEKFSIDHPSSVVFNNIDRMVMNTDINFFDTKDNIVIRSTLSVPIYINQKLFGMISIDSTQNNIFSVEHCKTMDFLKEQLTISLSKLLMFRKIKNLSIKDHLTSLYSRHYFEKEVQKLIETSTPFTLAFLDLNGLKKINDMQGHAFGDELIKCFSSELSTITEHQIAGRLGGDEFAVAFINKSKVEISNQLNYLQNRQCITKLMLKDKNMHFSFSYGLSEYPKDDTLYNDLLIKSDLEMYANKKEFYKVHKKENDRKISFYEEVKR